MAAGAVAGSLTVLITNPIWVVNTRMTAGKREEVLPGAKPTRPKGTIATFLTILREEGMSGIFAGVMPALVLVINPILQYTVFEQLKNMVEKRRRVTPTDAFYLGALGKLVATSVTYPYITVKSRMHVAGKDGPKDDMMTSLRKIVNQEGVAGLYGGKNEIALSLLPLERSIALTYSLRHCTKGYPECADRCLLVCLQGRSI
jgi:adenine nucleotide transporter 17